MPHDELEIADSRDVLKVPTHHSAMTQSDLLKEILTHRQALLKARALNTIGEVSDPNEIAKITAEISNPETLQMILKLKELNLH